MSTGAVAPIAAAFHDASRNSAPVCARSAARVRTFSGSSTSTRVPAGSTSVSNCISPSTSAGVSASIPATGIPSASEVSISTSEGSSAFSTASSAARSRTGGVSSSSRQGWMRTTDASTSG
ncbi:Uncharacterised protein [Mycobacteroides abscessus subsp. abscessus]|nr:Uncharacterised protein [Mycobacteroides abscessus subsp. abscessus]